MSDVPSIALWLQQRVNRLLSKPVTHGLISLWSSYCRTPLNSTGIVGCFLSFSALQRYDVTQDVNHQSAVRLLCICFVFEKQQGHGGILRPGRLAQSSSLSTPLQALTPIPTIRTFISSTHLSHLTKPTWPSSILSRLTPQV